MRLVALVSLCFASGVAAAQPAFLDSPTQIRLGFEKPRTQDEIEGKFRASLNGKAIAIQSITVAGDPERERLLPRTPGRIVLPGSFQSKLGGKDWDPDGESTQMLEVRPGVFELVLELPKGNYEYKVARDGSWAENYGAEFKRDGSNLLISVPAENTIVKFVVDLNTKTIFNSLQHPDKVTAPTLPPAKRVPTGPLRYPFAVITLKDPLPLSAVSQPILVRHSEDGFRTVYPRGILDAPEFVYTGDDLGAKYEPTATRFKVWSPVSSQVNVLLFDGESGTDPKRVPMTLGSNGVWYVTVEGDLHLTPYVFEFQSFGTTKTATDIYSLSATTDSKRSLVVDLAKTNPEGWPLLEPNKLKSATDAVIYEISVRDFSSRPSSGVPEGMRGKYAALSQRGTKSPVAGFKTGLDYLVDLGVTDIHLLPIHNFLTSSPNEYTWGYATNLFNVPEETYSVTPNDAVGVLKEFKGMVYAMQQAGLRVVLDVVYNHSWPPQGDESNFWQAVPYYYVRTNDRGDVLNESGVGNALADERPMVRKFIQDSLLYWMREYKVNGFRFDLLGLHNPDSVASWVKAMRTVRPDATLYGEPWTGGGPTRFGKGAQKGLSIAVFNDNFRNTFRGDLDGTRPGFALGGGAPESELRQAITGWSGPTGFTQSPEETINYVSAHDNMTWLDRIAKSIDAKDPVALESASRFGLAAVILSQGIPFIEGGSELGRTKDGNHNSYNAGDVINGYDWERASKFAGTANYLRGLISIRRTHRAFRLTTAEDVEQVVNFLPSRDLPDKTIAFRLNGKRTGDTYEEYFVVLHGGLKPAEFKFPPGRWAVLADGQKAGIQSLGYIEGDLVLPPLTAWVLAK